MFTVVTPTTSLSLDDHFIKRPAATFFVTVEGGGMAEHGILASDTLIVDGSAFNHALAHQARIVLIEKAGPGLQLVQDLRNDPTHGFPRPMGIVPEGDRWMRMEAQTLRFEAGHVLLPEEAAWLADFLSFFGTISVIANIATCELFSLRLRCNAARQMTVPDNNVRTVPIRLTHTPTTCSVAVIENSGTSDLEGIVEFECRIIQK